jgi:hypothetical protein
MPDLEYSFREKNDRYYIQNLDDFNSINFEVKKSLSCQPLEFETMYVDSLLGGEEKEVFLRGDGVYQIFFPEDNPSTPEVEGITITIKKYDTLLSSIIEGMGQEVCECNCGCDCNEERDDNCGLLMLRAKMDVYKRLINPAAVSFFDAVYSYVGCLIKGPLYCAVDNEIITGEADCNKKLIKQILSLDYLALYYFEMASACLHEDKDYIREKFNTKKIFCCIQSLGIDVGIIETLIKQNMGTFTINSAPYVNQAPSSVGDYELDVNNRAVTPLNLAMFTTLTTPAYADPEGDAVKEVRIDTLPQDGVLKLSGAPVSPGTVILVADINAGNLVYDSPLQDTFDTDSFDFSLSDVGSGEFTN